MPAYLLVVESDPDLQRRVGEALRDTSYEVAAETEVSWARRSIAVRTPDAVILDTSLSDGPGFTLADELRDDPETRQTPIVFLASRRFRGANHRSVAVRRYAPAAYLDAPGELGELRVELDAIFEPASPAAGAAKARARALEDRRLFAGERRWRRPRPIPNSAVKSETSNGPRGPSSTRTPTCGAP